jgi:hypothetical protein
MNSHHSSRRAGSRHHCALARKVGQPVYWPAHTWRGSATSAYRMQPNILVDAYLHATSSDCLHINGDVGSKCVGRLGETVDRSTGANVARRKYSI